MIIMIISGTKRYTGSEGASKAASIMVGNRKKIYTVWHVGLSRN